MFTGAWEPNSLRRPSSVIQENLGGLLYPHRVPLHPVVTLNSTYPADVAADVF
jgi:hypothetical protein